MDTLSQPLKPQRLWALLMSGQAADREPLPAPLEYYDFLAFTDKRPIRVPLNRCLVPRFAQPTFQIFTVVHDPSCAGPAG